MVPVIGEQLLVGDLARVVDDFHRLGMPGAAARHLLIARIGDVAAGIAGDGLQHARHLVEVALHAPEAAAGKGGDGPLRRRRLGRVLRAGRAGYGEGRTQAEQQAGHAVLPKSFSRRIRALTYTLYGPSAIHVWFTRPSRLCEAPAPRAAAGGPGRLSSGFFTSGRQGVRHAAIRRCPRVPRSICRKTCHGPWRRRWRCTNRAAWPKPSRSMPAILAERPDHFDALQMLALIKLAKGEPPEALAPGVGGDAAAQALAADPAQPRHDPARARAQRGGAGELRRRAQAEIQIRRGAQ